MDGDSLTVNEDERVVVFVDDTEYAFVMLVAASALLLVRNEVGDFYVYFFSKMHSEHLHLAIEVINLAVAKRHLFIGKPCSLLYCCIMTCQGCEWSELGGSRFHRHPRMMLWFVMRQIDYVFVSAHALCPPICWLRSRWVAPSS